MWLEIDEELGPMGSKSAWIARAVKEKLEGNSLTVAEATDIQLLGALLNRGVLYHELFYTLKYQVEERQTKIKDKESSQ
jgi:hypothetical protein